MTYGLLVGLGVNSLYRRDIDRRRHIIDYSIKQLLYTLVLVGSTAAYRNHMVCDGGLAYAVLDLVYGQLFAAEIFFQELIVLLGNRLEQFYMILVANVLHVLGNILNVDIGSEIVIINVSLHLNKVNKSLVRVLAAYRKLNGNGITFKTLMHHGQNPIKIGTHYVHLINIDHSGDMIFIGLTPYCFGLGLNAALCTKNGNRAVKNSE